MVDYHVKSTTKKTEKSSGARWFSEKLVFLLGGRWFTFSTCFVSLCVVLVRSCCLCGFSTESIPDAPRSRNTPFYPLFSLLNPVSCKTILRVAGRGIKRREAKIDSKSGVPAFSGYCGAVLVCAKKSTVCGQFHTVQTNEAFRLHRSTARSRITHGSVHP